MKLPCMLANLLDQRLQMVPSLSCTTRKRIRTAGRGWPARSPTGWTWPPGHAAPSAIRGARRQRSRRHIGSHHGDLAENLTLHAERKPINRLWNPSHVSRRTGPGEILETQTGLLDTVPTQDGQGQRQSYDQKQIDEKAIVVHS